MTCNLRHPVGIRHSVQWREPSIQDPIFTYRSTPCLKRHHHSANIEYNGGSSPIKLPFSNIDTTYQKNCHHSADTQCNGGRPPIKNPNVMYWDAIHPWHHHHSPETHGSVGSPTIKDPNMTYRDAIHSRQSPLARHIIQCKESHDKGS